MDFDYERLGAGYYDDIVSNPKNGIRKFWHLYKFERIQTHIEFGPGLRILDVGCAAGSFLGTLPGPFSEAVGIDISPTQIAYAERKYGSEKIRFKAINARSLELGVGTFDVIVVSEVIEHISYEESVELIARLKKLLRPQGRILLTTPNYRSLWPVVEFIINRILPVNYEHQHINRLDRSRFRQLVERSGLQVVKEETFFILGPFLAALSYGLARWVCRWESSVARHLGSIILLSVSSR